MANDNQNQLRGLTTGPIENRGGKKLIVDVLNNNQWNNNNNNNNNNGAAFITITVFSLDGTKSVLATKSFFLNPQQSKSKKIDISDVRRYAVEIQNGNGNNKNDKNDGGIQASVWAKDEHGDLIAAQRVINQELINQDEKKK